MGCARVWRGRGRRPRRPAYTMASPWTSPWARRAEDVAPYQAVYPNATWPARAHGVHGASVVGADVPGGPRTRWRLDGIPMRAARRGRRALPGGVPGRNVAGTGAWCSRGIRGRGRRPRRPAYTMASPWTSPLARRAHGRHQPVCYLFLPCFPYSHAFPLLLMTTVRFSFHRDKGTV